MSAADWVRRAEAAASAGTGDDEVRVLRAQRPAVLDPEGVKAVLAPMLASLVWAAAGFREMVAGSPLDPLAVLLRLLALGLTLRVLLLGAMLAKRVKVWLHAPRYVLVLCPEGLFYRTPEVDVVVPKEDVLGVMERGRWQERAGGRRWSEVYVVTDPATGRTHLALPPLFDGTPGQLAERLMRWRGAIPAPDEPARGPLAERAEKLWDDAVRGVVPEGVTVIRHGREWLVKAPYAMALVGVIVAEALLRAGPDVLGAIEPAIGGGLVLVFLAIPARWLWMTRREIRPRRGVSLVLTAAELLIRTHAGMIRTRWKDLAKVSADGKRAWSVLLGAHTARQLVFTRVHAPAVRYDEPYLGVPVEVAQILVESYRRGVLPHAPAADSKAVAQTAREPIAPSRRSGAELDAQGAEGLAEGGPEHGEDDLREPGDG